MSLNSFSEALDGAPQDALVSPQHLDLRLKPATDTSPVAIVIPTMKLTAIPGAMRKMGWGVAASLMDRWFASPAWTMPPGWKDRRKARAGDMPLPLPTQIAPAQVDDRLVTMAWATHFPICREACDVLLSRVTNPATVDRIWELLNVGHWDGLSRFTLGNSSYSARQIDEHCQVNAITFGGKVGTLDDMFGALGSATAKIGVVGEAMLDALSGRRLFHIRKVGLYLRDHYDFNGLQFLGTWTENGVLSKAQMLTNAFLDAKVYAWHGEGIGSVFNSDFEDYRAKYHRGGDVIVYSDVLWIELDRYLDLGNLR